MKKSTKTPKKDPLELKLNQTEEKLKRTLADYQNLEKRIETQKQVFLTFSLLSIFDKLLASLDDFYLVQNHLKDKGLQMALDKLNSLLKSEGLEEIEALHKDFDPQTMDCVETTDQVSKDIVSEVKKTGYKFNGQVVRPAQVVVGTKTN